jgi:uncharacterized protein (TIGR03435 family)
MASMFLWFAAIVPALGNHLWQSTVFAAAAGLLTLPLSRNHARVRFWLWFAASAKFLLPFSLLIAVGSHLAGAWSATVMGSNTSMSVTINRMSQPFDQVAGVSPLPKSSTGVQPAPARRAEFLRFFMLASAWLAGALAVLVLRCTQWRRVSKILRAARPLTEGREVKTLLQMEHVVGLVQRIEMRQSSFFVEPGIVGIFFPVLLWPKGISGHLNDEELEAVLVHEICHVRQRDNLTSALHMLVETIFWFYPLVWWLQTRLVAERERACDEEVLRLGRHPQPYAEGILKVCEFCVESPLSCVSGITGADLKKRIIHIMTASLEERLSGGRKALLAVATVVAITVPVFLGQANGSPGSSLPRFEVATIKPPDPHNRPRGGQGCHVFPGGRILINNLTLKTMIAVAFNLDLWQISGGDKWTQDAGYIIEAKPPETMHWNVNQNFGFNNIEDEHLREMLQALLIDRFQLKFHRETKTGDIFLLEKSGKHIMLVPTAVPPADQLAKYPTSGGNGNMGLVDGRWVVHNMSTQQIAHFVSALIWQRPVVDRTGITGQFNFAWQMDEIEGNDNETPDAVQSLIKAMGLKLVPAKGSVETLVIDHAEPPSPN